MSKFTTPPKAAFGSLRLVLFMAAALLLTACSSDKDTKSSDVYIGDKSPAEIAAMHGWATMQNLDPRGEQCVQCHGKDESLSPNGGKGHNVGLKNNTDHSAYADLKITGVQVNETSGAVTVTLNKPIPANAGNLSMTFAKLAPRVIHDRGHDWQNYFVTNALGFGENRTGADKMMLKKGGVQPQTVPNPQVSGNKITFSLATGRSWGEHDFTVKSKYDIDNATGLKEGWKYEKVKGTKFSAAGWDIAEHTFCDIAHEDANQTESLTNYTYSTTPKNSKMPVCWWPDGTHLTAGTFVTDNNEFVVEYQPDYTHRVTLILAGSPGFNTWYDFVPATGEAFDAATYSATDGDGKHVNQNLPAAREVVDVQSCNSCHDSLSMHGGARAQTQVCVTCHNPGNLQASSGRSVDFKQLIHRIHRGADLPSIARADLMDEGINGKTLVAKHATDFTKVRFPQGPTPGSAAGITNCVKCHMGSETNRIVQELADELGADDFDVQSKMKLAKVTPQGDNWLSVRSVNACQACHDSQSWFAATGEGNKGGNDTLSEADLAEIHERSEKTLPLYGDDYLKIGYKWLGNKGVGAQSDKWIHRNTGIDSFFTCGSGGGCHNNPSLDTITVGGGNNTEVKQVGDNDSNRVHRRHLQLPRNYIIAERFAIEISESKVNSAGEFTATVQMKDKNTGNYLAVGDDLSSSIAGLTSVSLPTGGQLAWMRNSPDYNHSPGGATGIPGNPLPVTIAWSGNEGTATANLANMPRPEEWNSIKGDFANIVGTVFVQGKVGDYSVQSATQDFRFDGKALAADEGRRKVVDFTAGNGIDDNRDRYAGWDKEHGANTQSCSSCHLQLSYHGGNRTNNVQVCVVCHNSQRTDVNGRLGNTTNTPDNGLNAADGQYEESLDFKRLIHAVHAAGGKDARVSNQKMRIDPLVVQNFRGDQDVRSGNKGNSFPGVLSNCKSCHIENGKGQWTFEIDQLPEGMIGSTAITADWKTILANGGVVGGDYDPEGKRHDFSNHLKMTPIASVCSSCHDAGYKGGDDKARMNANILDGGPYVGSHWWVMGGIAPGIVPDGAKPSTTKHQSGKWTDFSKAGGSK